MMGSRGQSKQKERRRAENRAARQLAAILGGSSGSSETASAAINRPYEMEAKELSGSRYVTEDGYYGVENGAHISEVDKLMGRRDGGMTDKWEASLTPDELEALKLYTGHGYTAMNGHMRGRLSEEDENDPVNQRIIGHIPALQSAVSKYELEKPTVFHRISGPSLLGGASTLSDIKKLIGKELKPDRGFTSASASIDRSVERELLWGAIPENGREPVIRYHIKAPAGKGVGAYVAGVSANKINEREFLFSQNAKFKVLGAYEQTKKTRHGTIIETHVNLEYVR